MQGLVRQIVGSNSRNLYRMGGTAISLSASQNGFYVLKLYTQNEASKEVGEEKLLGISFCGEGCFCSLVSWCFFLLGLILVPGRGPRFSPNNGTSAP